MVDQRHTLPNLKYLLTVLTAGKGELPVRKKGGVKVLEEGPIGEQKRPSEQRQEAEKSPLMNGKNLQRGTNTAADEVQNT